VQRAAARLPLLRRLVARDGAEIFDIVQGFVRAQVLSALIELRVLHRLAEGPATAEEMATPGGLAPARMETLLQAGAAIGLLARRRDGRFRLARKGAALLGVPGLEAMIRHHDGFYRDMADPVALLRGGGDTHMARFWPYVLGAAGQVAPEDAARYSDLMAQSQVLVAQDTLRMIRLRGIRHLMDVGGGSGVFAAEVARRDPAIAVTVFDLPQVAAQAEGRLAGAGRITFRPGSFRDGPLPGGADAISLVRVLYDHDDATVADLLAKAHAALPPGGRLIVSEPMSGGARPDPVGDVYFAFYTMAMGTGQVRSAETIAALCRAAGFVGVQIPRAPRPYVTRALTCVKPG
jgi:demethylspheroidene O-methyltransferase